MADVSYLKISERSNAERTNMRIEEIASNAKYRKDEQLKNLTIFWESCNFVNLLIFKSDNSKILLKFRQFRKLSNFHSWNFF